MNTCGQHMSFISGALFTHYKALYKCPFLILILNVDCNRNRPAKEAASCAIAATTLRGGAAVACRALHVRVTTDRSWVQFPAGSLSRNISNSALDPSGVAKSSICLGLGKGEILTYV